MEEIGQWPTRRRVAHIARRVKEYRGRVEFAIACSFLKP
jgi:hypothetical protein